MRNLKRNGKTIFYANLSNDVTVEWGNTIQAYGEPQKYTLPVSLDKGEIVPQGYGNAINYYREMITHDMHCPIEESSRLWIDRTPDQPHNYRVKRKSESLNCIVYVLERVEVSKDDGYI